MRSSHESNITLPPIKYLLSNWDSNQCQLPSPPPFNTPFSPILPITTAESGSVARAIGKLVNSESKDSATMVTTTVTKKKCNCNCNCKYHSRYIPRPKNAFILYRQHLHQFLFPKDKSLLDTQGSFKTNSQVSREIGHRWRSLPPDEKKYWQDLADNEKELHKEKYPDYKYVPRKIKSLSGEAGKLSHSKCIGTCDYCKSRRKK